MTDAFVIVDVPPPNIVVIEQPAPNFVIVEGGNGGGIVTGVLTFDGRSGAVGFELADAELIFSANGQLLVGTGTATGDLLSPGSDGDVLTMVSGSPAWAAAGGGGGFTAGGDLSGSDSSQEVIGLLGTLFSGSPSSGDTIEYDGTNFIFTTPGGGGGFDSLTGAGESATPGDLTQAGGFIVNSPSGSSTGINLSDDSSFGVSLQTTGSGGISLSSTAGTNGISLSSVSQLVLQMLGSGGDTLQIQQNDTGGIQIADFTGGGITVLQNGSLGGNLELVNNDTGGILIQDEGGGGLTLEGTGNVLMPTLPTSDPMVSGALWADSDNVVLSGFTGGGGASFPDFTGSGSPEGVQVANVGQFYVDTSGSTAGLYVFQGTNGSNTGWTSVGGEQNGVPGIAINGTLTVTGPASQGVYITDEDALSGTFNFLFWNDTGGDGNQSLNLRLGAASTFNTNFESDGSTHFPGPVILDTTVDGGSATIFALAGSPVSTITPNAAGDVCVDVSTPAIWQAGSTSDTSWVNVLGGSSGGWPSVDGTGSGNLTAATGGGDTVGYSLTDNGSGGINLNEGGTGGILIETSGGGVTTGIALSTQPTDTGGISLGDNGSGGIQIFGTGGVAIIGESVTDQLRIGTGGGGATLGVAIFTQTGDLGGVSIGDLGSGGINIQSAGIGAIAIETTAGGGTGGIALTTQSTDTGGVAITDNGTVGIALNNAGTGNVILTGIPAADPHVVGALYTTAGALFVSAG